MNHRHALAAAGLSLALAASFAVAGPASAATGGTTYTWVGSEFDHNADDHSWTDANNWSPNGVPGDGDSAVVQGPAADHCSAYVDHVPTAALASLTVRPTISKFGDPCWSSLDGGALSVSDSFTWSGGRIQTDVTLLPNAHGQVTDVTRELILDADLDVYGTLSLSGTAQDLDADGDSDTSLAVWRPHELRVHKGATLSTVGENVLSYYSCCVTPGRLVNDGTIELGGNLTADHLAVDQRGALKSDGSELVSDGGIATATNGATYSGAGVWRLRSGVVAHLNGTQHLADGFRIALGIRNSDDVAGQLGGTYRLSGSGTLGWYSGVLESGLTLDKGIRFDVTGVATGNGARVLRGRDYSDPAGPKGNRVSVVNHGLAVVGDGATIGTAEGANLVNAADGSLQFEPGTSLDAHSCCIAPDRVSNYGHLSVADLAGKPVGLHNVSFGNAGTITVPAGRLLAVTGGAPTHLHAGAITGTGRVAIYTPAKLYGGTRGSHAKLGLGGTLELRGATTIAGWFDVLGGTVVNRGTFTITGAAPGRLFTRGAFTQTRGATLHLDAGSHGFDTVVVSGRASVAGALVVHDATRWAPRFGQRVTPLRTGKGLAFAAGVTTARGWLAPRYTHWSPRRGPLALTLVAVRG